MDAATPPCPKTIVLQCPAPGVFSRIEHDVEIHGFRISPGGLMQDEMTFLPAELCPVSAAPKAPLRAPVCPHVGRYPDVRYVLLYTGKTFWSAQRVGTNLYVESRYLMPSCTLRRTDASGAVCRSVLGIGTQSIRG